MPDVEFSVPDNLVGGTYANIFRSNVAGNAASAVFVLDFAVNDDRINQPGRAFHALGVARIRLDPSVVQTMLSILSNQLSEMEGYSGSAD